MLTVWKLELIIKALNKERAKEEEEFDAMHAVDDPEAYTDKGDWIDALGYLCDDCKQEMELAQDLADVDPDILGNAFKIAGDYREFIIDRLGQGKLSQTNALAVVSSIGEIEARIQLNAMTDDDVEAVHQWYKRMQEA